MTWDRTDGDPYWTHDQECSQAHPCADCEEQEELRLAFEEQEAEEEAEDEDRD